MPVPGPFKKGARFLQSARRSRAAVPQAWMRDGRLEDRCLLASGVTFPTPNASLSQVLYNGVTGTLQKSITITNNNPTQFLYAFLEGEDTRQAIAPYQGTSAFDPFDPAHQEYRGYIGYTDGTTNYAGLPPLSSITITVPLAFWDSGRIIFSTDGTDQFSTAGGDNGATPTGAPFYYLNENTSATFYGNIAQNSNQLMFTPIYNGFDTANPYMPTTANWKSPITSGLFQDGQTYNVTGPGLPAAGVSVTINSADPAGVTLPANEPAETAQPYVFTLTSGGSISSTQRNIEGGFTLTTQGSPSTTDGLVMWYHALNGQSPNNDAPAQLTEFTFRGSFYNPASNTGTGFQYLLGNDVLAGADVDSADYDISFVDSLNVPVAIEASNVTLPSTGPGSPTSAPYGWVGSGQSESDLQAAISAFTSNNPNDTTNDNDLGTYFGGRGYPTFYTVEPGNLKIPSGQNLFFESVASGSSSDILFNMTFPDGTSIKEPYAALSSGGSGPAVVSVGGDPNHPSQGNTIGLNTSADADKYALTTWIEPNIQAGHQYDVTYIENGVSHSLGTTTGLAVQGGQVVGVNVTGTAPANAADQVYNFSPANADYAATTIAGLWYSWAKYYAENVNSTPPPEPVSGTISNGNILTLSQPTAGLVPGMGVAATGLPAGTVILSISSDNKTIELSAVPQGSDSPTSFTFTAPSLSSIAGSNPNPAGDINFTIPSSQQAFALAFAQTVFVVMSAWSVSVPAGSMNGWNTLLGNIIGGNTDSSFLPNANVDVVNTLTVLSKSALRGVPDYTNPLYSNPEQWYPDPALPAGGQTYNVFNLDPFVWFVHEKLGLTAYAFALDDDIGNVNAGGATNIAIAVGGLDEGLPQKDPYTTLSPFGVVTTTSSTAQGNSGVLGGLGNEQIVYQTSAYQYNNGTPGTLVNGPGVPMGTTVQFLQINAQTPSLSDIVLSNPLTSATAGSTYSFFGPLIFTGTVLGAGQADDTILLSSVDAYNTLEEIGPLGDVQVTGEGIDPGTTVTIMGLTMDATTGIITLQLSSALDPTLVSQPGSFYAYTFGSAVVPLIHDPGFEWADVQGLTGGFNHGAQLSQNTVDWTFTDSAPYYAGIAYSNTSTYTTNSPLPPQGLQVGFIQGTSSISQIVTLTAGAYTLSLDAAQRNTPQSPQSLEVLVDGIEVGTIQATDTMYRKYSVEFTVGTGRHTITFEGTQASDSTALIDALSLAPGSSLSTPPPPTLALNPIPAQSVDEGSPVSFTATASGSTSALTYSLDPGAPAGAMIDPLTGAFTWTPTAPGTYSVTVRVTDDGSPPQSDAETVSIMVNDVAPVVRLDPVFAMLPGATFRETGSFAGASPGSFVADVDFGDGTGLQPLPLGPSGTFVLAHTYTRPGTYTVTVDVRDAFGGVGTADLTLTATAAPLVSGYGLGRDAFVTELYLEDLGRPPDPSELKLWSRRLANGVNRRVVARYIWGSPEHRMLVKRGLLAPIGFERSYRDASVVKKQTIRRHLPPPTGPLTLSIAGPSPAKAGMATTASPGAPQVLGAMDVTTVGKDRHKPG